MFLGFIKAVFYFAVFLKGWGTLQSYVLLVCSCFLVSDVGSFAILCKIKSEVKYLILILHVDCFAG